MDNDAATAIDALVLNAADNIAVCLSDIAAAATITVKRGEEAFSLTALEAVERGHKIAIRDLPQDTKVVKYAEIIGTMTRHARAGEHVHIHNLSD